MHISRLDINIVSWNNNITEEMCLSEYLKMLHTRYLFTWNKINATLDVRQRKPKMVKCFLRGTSKERYILQHIFERIG